MSAREIIKTTPKKEISSVFLIFSCFCLAKNKSKIYYDNCYNLVKKEASLDVILDKLYNFQKINYTRMEEIQTEIIKPAQNKTSKFKEQGRKIEKSHKDFNDVLNE